jgi:xeroderma pigmentosum group C-complementing protein
VPKRKRIKESTYPVFWVEAFNAAVQKWVPVDPLVTNSIAKPSTLEPPASDAENIMSYVVAFEEDGTARDVTRRYVKAFNAKTRRLRIESTKGGERWWRKTMRVFSREWELDRDQVEDAELAAKEAAEEMPRNVQDFKDHPYYALERHLKRNEALHPKREVGKIGAGKSMSGTPNKALEPIYRRRDAHHVRSADGWYRLGREIKVIICVSFGLKQS